MNKVLSEIVCLAILGLVIIHCGSPASAEGEDIFRLRVFEAAIKNDVSLCAQDKYCLDHMRYYRSLICVDEVCNAKKPAMKSVDCAPLFAAMYTPQVQDKISDAMCTLINQPSPASRQAYLALVVNETEGEAVELGAYLMAMRGSAVLCAEYIRQYVGDWGPDWNFQWIRALSGCRVLAGVRTWQEEEKDLQIWLAAAHGCGQCSDISNIEMKEACLAPGAVSPAPKYELLW